jgi:hypothetical protein
MVLVIDFGSIVSGILWIVGIGLALYAAAALLYYVEKIVKATRLLQRLEKAFEVFAIVVLGTFITFITALLVAWLIILVKS